MSRQRKEKKGNDDEEDTGESSEHGVKVRSAAACIKAPDPMLTFTNALPQSGTTEVCGRAFALRMP
jgi:hypothetical protein